MLESFQAAFWFVPWQKSTEKISGKPRQLETFRISRFEQVFKKIKSEETLNNEKITSVSNPGLNQ
jgi:hypothetical protein